MPVIDIGRYPSSFDVFVLLLAMTTPFSLGLIAGGLYGWLIPRLGFLSGLSIGFYIGLAVNFITPCTFAVVAYASRVITFVSIPLPEYLAWLSVAVSVAVTVGMCWKHTPSQAFPKS